MPFEIKLSQLPQGREPLDQAVQEYIAKMAAFSQTVGQPRPVTSPIIEACVKRVQRSGFPDSYEPDYIIVDDAPPPPPALNIDDQKSLLMAQLAHAENVAKNSVMKVGKIRLASLRMQAASTVLEADRTPQQHKDISHYQDVAAIYNQIEMAAAQAQSDIEDLTEETIAAWSMPDLRG